MSAGAGTAMGGCCSLSGCVYTPNRIGVVFNTTQCALRRLQSAHWAAPAEAGQAHVHCIWVGWGVQHVTGMFMLTHAVSDWRLPGLRGCGWAPKVHMLPKPRWLGMFVSMSVKRATGIMHTPVRALAYPALCFWLSACNLAGHLQRQSPFELHSGAIDVLEFPAHQASLSSHL